MKSVLVALLFLGVAACSHGQKHHEGHEGHHHDHAAHEGHKHGHDHHEKMWKTLDQNSDGKISKDEFKKGHGEKFSEMDKNNDGSITKEEMSSFHKEMMGKDCENCKKGKTCDKCTMKEDCKEKGHCEA